MAILNGTVSLVQTPTLSATGIDTQFATVNLVNTPTLTVFPSILRTTFGQTSLVCTPTININAPIETTPSVQVGQARSISLHLLNGDGSYRCRLLDYVDLSINRQVASPGSFTFKYPVLGGNFAALREFVDQKKRCDVVAWVNTDNIKYTLRATIMEASWDDVDPLQEWTFNGFFQEHWLAAGVLYPVAANAANGGSTVYNGATPGALVLNAIGGMQARTTLTNLTTSTFTATTDSKGATWPNTITITFNPGASLADILNELVNQGLLQYEVTSALELKIYNPSSWGVDHTTAQPALTFKSSHEVVQAPHKYSAVDIASRLVAIGGQGLNSIQNNTNELALLNGYNVEKFLSVGSLQTQAQLNAYAQLQATTLGNVSEEVSHALNMHDLAPMPLQDFNLGDWVYSDTPFSASKTRLQVAQWTLSAASGNQLSGIVTLNTLFYTQAVAFNRLLKRMLNGTVNVGVSTPQSTVPVKDGVTPAAPTGLNASSIAYLSDGNPPNILSEVTVSWAAPTLRSDGSALTDLLGYRVRYQLQNRQQESGAGAPTALITPTWYVVTPDGGTSGTSWTFGNVLPGATIYIQVAAFDTAYEQGAWSASYSMITQNNIVAPPIPSVPIVTPWFKTINVNWDGNTSTGASMLTAYRLFDHIEVHASTVTGFTPSTATLQELIYAAPGVTNIVLPTYNTYFIKFIAVSNVTSGSLKSQASAQASGAAQPAISQDIGNQIIAAVNMQDGQPLGPKISSQQVSTPHLTVGVFSDSLVPNGGFDDAGLLGSSLPAYWTVGTNTNAANTLTRDTTAADVFSGAACAKFTIAAATDTIDMRSAVISCKAGDNFFFELEAKASRALNGLAVSVLTGTGNPPTTSTSLSGGNIALTTTYPTPTLQYNFNVPSGATYLQLVVTGGNVTGDAAAVNIFIDSVRVRKVVGTAEIQDAAISRAKIGLLQVDSGRIASLDAGTIISGTMTATITNSGLFRTSTSGARVEFDGAGLRLYAADGVTVIGNWMTSNSSMLMTGQMQTALSGQRLVMNPGGNQPDHIYVYPSGSGDFANIFTRDAPADGSAAILIDGGAQPNIGRGRLGAYKSEAFVSFVVNDSSGGTQTGYSATAVSVDSSYASLWCQTAINFDLYQGSAIQNFAHMQFQWKSGSQSSFQPMLATTGGAGTPNAAIKFDSATVCATFADGVSFTAMKATAFNLSSTESVKSDIIDARYILNPIQQIKRARSQSWKYKDEIRQYGNAAHTHFGPVAEDLDQHLIYMTPAARGGGMEASVSLGDQIGILWAAMNQIIDQLESHGVPMPTGMPQGAFMTALPRLLVG